MVRLVDNGLGQSACLVAKKPRSRSIEQAVVGSPDQVAEQIKTRVLDAGVDGVILSPVTSISGYRPGGITAVGEALKPLVRG